jgi:hypothetical protein
MAKISRIDIIGANSNEGLHYLRKCNMCHKEKPLVDFHKSNKDGAFGYQHHCKKCSTKYKQINKEQAAKIHKKNHQKDYRLALIRAAKHRAKEKNIPFDITKDDLELIWKCPVLGIDIFSAGLNNPNAPSIDRIIPCFGYIKGNVKIISRRANTLKGDATLEEVKLIMKYIDNEIKKKLNNGN